MQFIGIIDSNSGNVVIIQITNLVGIEDEGGFARFHTTKGDHLSTITHAEVLTRLATAGIIVDLRP